MLQLRRGIYTPPYTRRGPHRKGIFLLHRPLQDCLQWRSPVPFGRDIRGICLWPALSLEAPEWLTVESGKNPSPTSILGRD